MNTVVIMITIAAISAGALTLNLDQFTGFNGVQKSGALMVTNVEAVMKDEAGNIIAYRQGDNHIVGSGMVILAQQTFGPGVGGSPASNNTNSTTAPHTLSAQVRYMEIGNGNGTGNCPGVLGSPILGWDNETLECPITSCARQPAIIYRHNVTNVGTTGIDSHAQINVTAIATFAGSAGCNGLSIDEAGIWTNSSGGVGGPAYPNPAPIDNRMFARNTFGSVNLSPSDSLELTWRFTFTDS